MHWNDYDKRLKKLYNTIAEAHNETTANWRAEEAETEALNLMEELTNLLNNK